MSMNNTQKDISHHSSKLLGLEVVRFVSALSVLIWHYQHFFYIARAFADLTES